MQGKFITFEGGEGSGKSTQSMMLFEALEKAGIETIRTREPGGTEGAEKIRKLLVEGTADSWDAKTELLLHLAARKDHLNRLIIPSLEAGKYVICDRFSDSTMAYQGYGHQLGNRLVEDMQKLAIGGFAPDLTIILDIEVEKGMARANKRKSAEDRYETMGMEFHKRVRQGFFAVAEQDKKRCVVINAENTEDAIHQEITGLVRERFGAVLV